MFGVGARDVWIVGDAGTLLRTSDHGETFVRCTVDPGDDLESVWASSADVVWIAGARHLYRVEDGATLATFTETLAASCGTGLHDVWGTSATDVWIANGSRMHTTDGGEHWTTQDATCADDVWAAGADVWSSGGTFFVDHSADRGETWSRASFTPHTEEGFRVRGSGPGDVWIVASLEGLAHSSNRGATWVDEALAGSVLVEGKGGLALHRLVDLYSVGDGWAFATDDGIWVRRGATPWVREIDVDAGLVSVWGTSSADVWAVGDHGRIVHRP